MGSSIQYGLAWGVGACEWFCPARVKGNIRNKPGCYAGEWRQRVIRTGLIHKKSGGKSVEELQKRVVIDFDGRVAVDMVCQDILYLVWIS